MNVKRGYEPTPEEEARKAGLVEAARVSSREEAQQAIDAPKQKMATARAIMEIDQKLSQMEDVLENTTSTNTGLAQAVFKWVPGSSQQAREATIDTIKSSIALEGMQQLKRESPTGSTGFGQLSNKELGVLENRIANLASSQNADAFKKNLQAVMDSYRRTRGLLKLEYSGWSDNPVEMIGKVYNAGLSESDARAIYAAQGMELGRIAQNEAGDYAVEINGEWQQ
jgi:hypothetical protein